MPFQKFFKSVAAVVRKAFFIADLNHTVLAGILHEFFKGVIYCSYKKCRIFIGKTTAGSNVSVGVNIENVAGTFAVVFAEPFFVLPGAGIVRWE